MTSKNYNRRNFLKSTGKLLGIVGVGAVIGSSLISCEKGMYPYYFIDIDLCTKCEKCVTVCKYNAITYQTKKIDNSEQGFKYLNIDNNKCYKCGKCIDVCPYNALFMLQS